MFGLAQSSKLTANTLVDAENESKQSEGNFFSQIGLGIAEGGDFGILNCQHTTKVDAR